MNRQLNLVLLTIAVALLLKAEAAPLLLNADYTDLDLDAQESQAFASASSSSSANGGFGSSPGFGNYGGYAPYAPHNHPPHYPMPNPFGPFPPHYPGFGYNPHYPHPLYGVPPNFNYYAPGHYPPVPPKVNNPHCHHKMKPVIPQPGIEPIPDETNLNSSPPSVDTKEPIQLPVDVTTAIPPLPDSSSSAPTVESTSSATDEVTYDIDVRLGP